MLSLNGSEFLFLLEEIPRGSWRCGSMVKSEQRTQVQSSTLISHDFHRMTPSSLGLSFQEIQ